MAGAVFGDTRTSIAEVSHKRLFCEIARARNAACFSTKCVSEARKVSSARGRVAVDEFILESWSDFPRCINNVPCVSSCVKILSHAFHGRRMQAQNLYYYFQIMLRSSMQFKQRFMCFAATCCCIPVGVLHSTVAPRTLVDISCVLLSGLFVVLRAFCNARLLPTL